MRKTIIIILCLLFFAAGICIGYFIPDKKEKNNEAYHPADEDFFGSEEYTVISRNDFKSRDVYNMDIYIFTDRLIADAYNSFDNYDNYKDVISDKDFAVLEPYDLGNGKSIRPTEPGICEFFNYDICSVMYTDSKAIVCYWFEYYQYKNDDCKEKTRKAYSPEEAPFRVYLIKDNGKWKVDHIFVPA